ncbi:MAG: amidohydrolase family protein [Syntrophales bacterium LBB04]|nr:amidohydrolase family protein [Syntrophales bacterium LBB04]
MLDFANDTSKLKHLKIRSVDAAMSAIKKATDLSIKYKKRLHICHVTSEEEVKYLKNIKNYKFISSEVTPQHLFLFGPEAYDNLENCAIVNPPIRYRSDADALWTALKEGIIDCIASDHAPHLLEEKQKNSPSGVPGVETMLPLMLNQASMGRCTINEIVKWMCENPANIFHIKNKGYIKEGFDADLVLIDPSKTKLIENGKLHTKCNWSPFHGTYIKGIPIMTIVNGNIIFQNNEFSMENQGKEVNFF